MTSLSEAMTPAERIRVHIAMPNGWCRGCWWEHRIRVTHPCGWAEGAARALAGPTLRTCLANHHDWG